MQTQTEKRWLSLNDVCRLTSLSRTTINSWRERGAFVPPIELGERRVAFLREDVEAWMAERERNRSGVDRLARPQVAA